MKNKLAFLLSILMLTSVMTFAGGVNMEVRLMNTTRIMHACGMKKYDNTETIVADIDVEDSSGIGVVEKNSSIIDTKEEFLTAAYYNIKILPKKAQKVISFELPKGKRGALRLTSMWLMKKATDPEKHGASANKAIGIIMKKSKVSWSAINRHYAKSIKKEIPKQLKKYLRGHFSTAQINKTIALPVINYYLNPTTKNMVKVAEMMQSIAYKGSQFESFLRFLIKFGNVKLMRSFTKQYNIITKRSIAASDKSIAASEKQMEATAKAIADIIKNNSN